MASACALLPVTAIAWPWPTPAPASARCGDYWQQTSHVLGSGAALRTAEAADLQSLANQICAGGKRKPWAVLDKALRMARLSPFAPPQAAELLRATASVTGALPEYAAATAVLRGAEAAVRAQWIAVPADPHPEVATPQLAAWSWLGPFGAEHGTAFARTAPIEAEAMARPTAAGAERARGREAEVHWQRLPATATAAHAPLQLHEWVDRPDDAIVYAQTWVRPAAGGHARAWLLAASPGPLRVWFAGRLVVDLPEAPAPDGLPGDMPAPPPADATAVALPAGWTRLLVKAGPTGARIAIGLSLVDDRGIPLPVQTTATAPDVVAAPIAVGAMPGIAPGLPPVRDASGNLAGEAIAALLQLAWHGWRLPADLHDELLNLPLDEVPADPVLALAHANLPGEAGDRLSRLADWRHRLPQSAELALAHALALDADGQGTAALRAWLGFRHAQGQGKAAPFASVDLCLGQLRLLRAAGAEVLAADALDRCLTQAPHRLLWEERLRKANAPVHAWPGWFSAETLHRALRDADWTRAQAQIAATVAVHPGRTRLWEGLARAQLDRNQAASGEATLQRVPMGQRRSQWHELAARAARALGRDADALALLQTAVALAPQRADLRTRLRLWTTGRDFYAEHRRDLIALVQRERAQPRRHPFEVRLRQTVLAGLGNGQQARYEAEIYYIGPGGPTSHSQDIDYAPSLSQAEMLQVAVVRANGQVDRSVEQSTQQFGDDSSGLYFDLARTTLQFRKLKPGDAIVVEHEISDLGPAPFGLVFGELLPLGDTSPVREVDITIRLPAGTPLHHTVFDPARPDARHPPPLRRELKTPGGDTSEWRWKMGPFAAAPSEARSPNALERAAVLHASSFASWQAAAAWFGALLREALPVPGQDPTIRELARKLAVGKDGTEAQVRAVFEFARAQVRYVGLEFGIHSIKPHAAWQVAQRQFGDCKDKATLIVALLAELGIDAQVALVRTSDLGQVKDGVASLGIFNHAIAYVPRLDWWLDATAVANGPLELPDGDCSGQALRIGTDSDLETLPDPDPSRQQAEVAIDVELAADGSAHLRWSGRFAGLTAAQLRGELAAVTNKKEKMEAELAPRWPGVAVRSVTVTGIEPQADVVTIAIDAQLSQLGVRQGQRLRWAPLRPSSALLDTWVGEETRKTPLLLPRPLGVKETLRLHLPPGVQVAELPSAASASGPSATFEMAAQHDDAMLQVACVWQVGARRVAVDKYPSLRAFFAKLDAALRGEIVLQWPLEAK